MIVISMGVSILAALSVGMMVMHVRRLSFHREAWVRPVLAAYVRLKALNRRWIPARVRALLKKQLARAGEPRGFQPEDIVSFQVLGLGVGLLLGLLLCWVLQVSWLWASGWMFLGALFPWFWLADKAQRRQQQIIRAMPYHLDLLTLAVEAGLDFASALARVVERASPGAFREELQLTLRQLKLGKTREESLRGLMARIDLPPLTLFVTALIQADRMGTSLGKVLRTQATQLRVDRAQRAEKLANQAPVKMLVPLVLCIFPTVFLVLLGPLVFAFLFGHAAG